MSEPQSLSHQSRIDSALGKIIRGFNLLELNLGLSIRFLENPGDVARSHAWLAKSSIQDKIDRFVELVVDNQLVADSEKLYEWHKAASNVRNLRHYYVHGTWEYLPLRSEAPVGFRIPPWRAEQLKNSATPTMTFEELEQDATAVESVFASFMALRRDYGV